jgi:hypothetical protein
MMAGRHFCGAVHTLLYSLGNKGIHGRPSASKVTLGSEDTDGKMSNGRGQHKVR